MNSLVQKRVIGAARRIFRAAWSGLLPAAGIACLGMAVVGCTSAFSPDAQQAQLNNPNTRYIIHDLGVFGSNPAAPGGPLVITNSGWISGAAGVGPGGTDPEHAVLYHGGKIIDVGAPGLGGNSMGYGVNESGVTAGEAEDPSLGLSTTEDFCGFQAFGFSSAPTPCIPFVWQKGQMVPLPTLGGVNGAATEINSSGMIGGYAETTTVDPDCPAPQKYQFKPAVWSHGAVQALPTGDDMEGGVWAINDLGQMAGASGSCGPLNFFTSLYFNPTHILLWQNGVATDLGNLGQLFNNLPHGMNNRGQVVGMAGYVDPNGNQTAHAFLASPGTKMQDLGVVGNDDFSFGFGINDAGEIVGLSANKDFSVIHAFIRQNGTLVDLNTLVTGNNPFPNGTLLTACFINSKGEITGIALDLNTGEEHAYLATPTSVPASAVVSNVTKHVVLPDWIRSQFRFTKPV
jgi:probable HAF family extracellular repeat protein